jgi:serine-type D-Ala-D-Ala carboxypeptidase (penicillin-binding protein 5/6)
MNKLLTLAAAALFSFAAQASAQAQIPDPPALSARSYALIDFDSGQLIAGHEADARAEPASITKVMTVYVALDEVRQGRIKLDDPVLVSEKAWRQGIDSSESRMFIEVGKRVSMIDLLRGIIVQSGNDAAVAIAEHIAGSEEVFAQLMNQYAKKLGMANTHFVDASGMPFPEHYSTARDLSLLGRALIRDFPEAYRMFAEREFVFNKIRQYNRNTLLDMDPSVDGIKTGHTNAAGYCLLSSAQRDGRRLVAAVMGTDSVRARSRDSKALLDYGFRFFETTHLFGADKPVNSLRIWRGAEKQLPVGTLEPMALALPRGAGPRLQFSQQIPAAVEAPVSVGQVVGTLNVTLDGTTVRSEPLVALKDIPEGSWWQRLIDWIVRWWASE